MEVTVEVLFRQVYLLRCLYYDSLYGVGNRHKEAFEDIEEEEKRSKPQPIPPDGIPVMCMICACHY